MRLFGYKRHIFVNLLRESEKKKQLNEFLVEIPYIDRIDYAIVCLYNMTAALRTHNSHNFI